MSAGDVAVSPEQLEMARTYERACRTVAQSYPHDQFAKGAAEAVSIVFAALGVGETGDVSEVASGQLSTTTGTG